MKNNNNNNNNFFEINNKQAFKECEMIQQEIKESIFYDDWLIIL